MDIQAAFGEIRSALPEVVGLHDRIQFKYAARGGVTLVEVRRDGVFCYWLLAKGEAELIRTSPKSLLRRLRPVGEFLSPQ